MYQLSSSNLFNSRSIRGAKDITSHSLLAQEASTSCLIRLRSLVVFITMPFIVYIVGVKNKFGFRGIQIQWRRTGSRVDERNHPVNPSRRDESTTRRTGGQWVRVKAS